LLRGAARGCAGLRGALAIRERLRKVTPPHARGSGHLQRGWTLHPLPFPSARQVAKYGAGFSYYGNPRAQIFRRDAFTVVDMPSMQAIIRCVAAHEKPPTVTRPPPRAARDSGPAAHSLTTRQSASRGVGLVVGAIT
jgi:hypothetical protein